MWPNPQFPADLVTFTKEILNGKLHFLSSKSDPVSDELNDAILKATLKYHKHPSIFK